MLRVKATAGFMATEALGAGGLVNRASQAGFESGKWEHTDFEFARKRKPGDLSADMPRWQECSLRFGLQC